MTPSLEAIAIRDAHEQYKRHRNTPMESAALAQLEHTVRLIKSRKARVE